MDERRMKQLLPEQRELYHYHVVRHGNPVHKCTERVKDANIFKNKTHNAYNNQSINVYNNTVCVTDTGLCEQEGAILMHNS